MMLLHDLATDDGAAIFLDERRTVIATDKDDACWLLFVGPFCVALRATDCQIDGSSVQQRELILFPEA